MVGLLTVALPAAIVLPVHYVGLLRGARAGPTTPLGDRWSLKHLWVISSLFLLASMSGAYLFAYDSLHALLFQAEEPALRSREAAHAGLFSVVGAAVAVLSFVRRHDYRQWIRGSWSPRQMLKPALAGLGVVFVVAVASQLLAYVLGWSHAGDWAGIGAGLTTMEVVRALRDVSGPWLLLPLLVVLVPVYEEIAFRGVFLASVGRHLPFAWANTLQASVFALIHDQIRHFPSLFAMGLIAGILTRRAGGLAPAIALHAAVNSATATAIYLVPLLATPDVEKEVKAAQPKPASPAELRKRCDAGNRVDCFQLGQRYSEGRGVPRDYATAASLLGKACDAEIGASCGRLGELHGAGLGVAKDDERAAQLFKRACDAGLPLHCEYLAIAYELGSGLPQDHSTASQLHKKACDSGYLRACSSLGRLYQLGSGVEKSTARAAQLYEKGCDDGDATGCDGLAGLHYYGDGVMQDFTLAAQLARKACDGGISRACGDLGWKYAHGEGVPQNLRTAAQFYQRACEGGDRARCANLGALYYLGSGVEKDHAQAERWFRLGCEHGDAHGCAELSGLYQRGEGVQRDAAGAWQLLEKACAAGLDNARCHRRPHAP